MKRILMTLLCALALCACNNENNDQYPYGPSGCLVWRFHSLRMNPYPYHDNDYTCNINVRIDRVFTDAYDALEKCFEQQIVEYRGEDFHEGEAYAYVPLQLTGMTLYADYMFLGRPAGENLIDLFVIETDEPLFAFPDGQLLQYIDRNSPESFSYQEFIDKKCFTPWSIYVYIPTENVGNIEELKQTINFTLTATYSDGKEEIVDTKVGALDFDIEKYTSPLTPLPMHYMP